MMVRIISILILALVVAAQGAYAEEVKLQQGQLILNANLDKAEDWPAGPTVLITHGTLSHNKSEIMTALQELFLENGVSSLAINLGLGLNDRHGPYNCTTPKIRKPVLVFAGTEDQVVKGLDVKLAPLAEAGDIDLEVMDGADHSFRDLYVEDLVERVVEFISEQ